jgi:hypothetical protein
VTIVNTMFLQPILNNQNLRFLRCIVSSSGRKMMLLLRYGFPE